MAAALTLLFVAGCGEGKYPVRPAKGRVVCQNQDIKVGSISFTPIGEPGDTEPGKAATAMIAEDGTFALTTFEPFDGAIVGKHRVQYVPPESEEESGGEKTEVTIPEGSRAEAMQNVKQIRQRYADKLSQCIQTKEIIVEVTEDGENAFMIELSPPPQPQPRRRF